MQEGMSPPSTLASPGHMAGELEGSGSHRALLTGPDHVPQTPTASLALRLVLPVCSLHPVREPLQGNWTTAGRYGGSAESLLQLLSLIFQTEASSGSSSCWRWSSHPFHLIPGFS